MNICRDCKHFDYETFRCKHPAVERGAVTHPQSGLKTFRISPGCFTQHKHPSANEINPNGDCDLYDAKVEDAE